MLLKRKRSLDPGSERGIKLVRESLEAGVSDGKDLNRRRSLESASKADIETFINGIRKPSVDSGLPVSFDEFEASKFVAKENLVRDSQQTALSIEDFKARLATFDMRRWSRKPDCIASFHCARFGWKLCEKGDALICVTCKQLIPVSGDGNAFAASSSGLKCGTQLRQAIEGNCHANSCPWKKYFSPVTILCLPQGFDMFYFLREGVASFQRTFTLPTLHSHYGHIMDNLDLTWMECIAGLKTLGVNIKSEDSENEKILHQQTRLICFLVLSGWSMKATNVEDGIGCYLCLREIPLWLCKSTADANSVCSLSTPVGSLKLGGRKYCSELDPINNHWWWCPWRRFLEFSDAATIVSSNVRKDLKDADFFEQRFEDSLCLKPHADKEDYLRLKVLIEQECSQAASISEVKVISPQVVSTVGSIMDAFLSPSRCSTLTSLADESLLLPCDFSMKSEGTEAKPVQFKSNSNSMQETMSCGFEAVVDSLSHTKDKKNIKITNDELCQDSSCLAPKDSYSILGNSYTNPNNSCVSVDYNLHSENSCVPPNHVSVPNNNCLIRPASFVVPETSYITPENNYSLPEIFDQCPNNFYQLPENFSLCRDKLHVTHENSCLNSFSSYPLLGNSHSPTNNSELLPENSHVISHNFGPPLVSSYKPTPNSYHLGGNISYKPPDNFYLPCINYFSLSGNSHSSYNNNSYSPPGSSHSTCNNSRPLPGNSAGNESYNPPDNSYGNCKNSCKSPKHIPALMDIVIEAPPILRNSRSRLEKIESSTLYPSLGNKPAFRQRWPCPERKLVGSSSRSSTVTSMPLFRTQHGRIKKRAKSCDHKTSVPSGPARSPSFRPVCPANSIPLTSRGGSHGRIKRSSFEHIRRNTTNTHGSRVIRESPPFTPMRLCSRCNNNISSTLDSVDNLAFPSETDADAGTTYKSLKDHHR